jgi:2-C-methyl-D-erythritol 4-phosphate cytidylyltransferase
MSDACNIWAVIPAAGIGKRMRSDIPKQYLQLVDRPVIEHTINRLLAVEQVKGVVVSLQADDPYWQNIHIESDKPVHLAAGGKERCHSVINALDTLSALADYSSALTWVLVHDAVRPCVSIDDIGNLIDSASASASGGLLAMPVRDTMKRQDKHQCVYQTVDRTGLWHALTPQLFPCQTLMMALKKAVSEGFMVTDESSAMEHAGYRPRLVEGREDNIKITRPADLRLAELYLKAMLMESGHEGRQ